MDMYRAFRKCWTCGMQARNKNLIQHYGVQTCRPRHRQGDNITSDLKDIGPKGINWIHLAQYRDKQSALVNTVMSLWVPQNLGQFLPGSGTTSFSRTLLHGVSGQMSKQVSKLVSLLVSQSASQSVSWLCVSVASFRYRSWTLLSNLAVEFWMTTRNDKYRA